MTINTNQIKLINRVYSALAYRLDNKGNRPYMSELFDMERDYEKRHRAFTGRQNYGKLTMALAARLISAQHVIDGLNTRYTVKDSLHVKDSVIMAQAIAENFPDEITEALDDLSPVEVYEFKALAYHELIESEAA
tara:strand:+ start:1125 stop:1529 length:405 start_codon:yes stop_codon:yes gene_type:complete